MLYLFLTIAAAYAMVLAFLYVFQRHLIYHPDRNLGAAAQYGLEGFYEHRIAASDGVVIQLWHRPANPGLPTIVYYHGNAYHMGNRAGILGALADKGFGVLALSYRGYGRSEGHPSEQGIYRDARAAIAFLTAQNIPLNRILLFGESLGTGVAVQMATEYDIAGVILEAPYISVAKRAAELYRFVPVMLLLHDRFDSLSKIARVKAPIMIFHGERDPTIPVAHGRVLLEAATSAKKAFFFPEVAHNDFDTAIISAHVLDFAAEHGLIAR